MKPLAIDLFAGKGGWSKGLLDAGFRVVGFDIAQMGYIDHPDAHLVIQDVLTLHGSQFRNAAAIVASPPCQKYSYMAMPWKRAKAMAAHYRANPELIESELNVLFNACFRLQREASEAAGRYIPLVVENVRGAQPWVGRAAWNYGSFYLWGDVPALMPFTRRAVKVPGLNWSGSDKPGYKAQAFNTTAEQRMRDDVKVPGFNFHQYEKTGKPGGSFQSAAVDGIKGNGGGWFSDARPDGTRPDWRESGCETRLYNSKSAARKEASARIAMIPYDLALHIGRTFLP